MDKINAWHYHITWHTRGHKPLLIGEIQKRITELIMQTCKEMQIHLVQLEVTAETIAIEVLSSVQINSIKTLKNLQKVLSKSLSKKFPELKAAKSDLWDKGYLITSINDTQSERDVRIEKLIDTLWSVEYYDLDEGMDDEELEAFKKYLMGRNLGIVDYGEQMFLVDGEAMRKEINLNCFECTKIHQYGCCCGSPCSASHKNKKLLKKHLPQIAEDFQSLEPDQYQAIVTAGGFMDDKGEIKECKGRCSLLVAHEGMWKCMAHKYALEQAMPIYDLCPLSCLMYPLEILELITDKQKKVILLTSVLTEAFAKDFGRWGSYESLDVELRCINKEAHNEIFKVEDYKPVYEVNKNLFIHEFGLEVYSGIEQSMQ